MLETVGREENTTLGQIHK